MEFKIDKKGDVTIVVLPGDHLDANNSKEFKNDIEAVLKEYDKMIFNMEQLKFVDSSGLGAILSCLRKLNSKDGDLKLYGMSKSVRALFELVRMHRVFDIYNSEDEAIRAYGE